MPPIPVAIPCAASRPRWETAARRLSPTCLSPARVLAPYHLRRRIEDAFLLTKLPLRLAYLWAGAASGIQAQSWTTWLLYALLADLAKM